LTPTVKEVVSLVTAVVEPPPQDEIKNENTTMKMVFNAVFINTSELLIDLNQS
jgi:hypothetical protein